MDATMDHSASQEWTRTPLAARLKMLRNLRDLLAAHTHDLVDALAGDFSRTRADSMAAEVLPLLGACKFLERSAVQVLAPRHLGRRGLPFWLSGIDATVERVPMGTILIVGPSNYPLFLPGVQTLQALAAGNRVVWKPGTGGAAVAGVFGQLCRQAGLPAGTLRVTDESVQSAVAEIKRRPDKIIFTGSGLAGREVQRLAAESSIPVVTELSGCDAVIVLPCADGTQVVDALCFGMRLNGSATCMAPRRLILMGASHAGLLDTLAARFAQIEPIPVRGNLRTRLNHLLSDAGTQGAKVVGQVGDISMRPLLVRNGAPAMALASSDIFAPVLLAMEAENEDGVVEMEAACPFGLTAAIFGNEEAARRLGLRLGVGTVLINDLIVPTADPRVPFGGRRSSGFGVTRGAEGLLEMTAVKTTSARRDKGGRHFQPTGALHEELFTGLAKLSHSNGWRARYRGLRQMVSAAKKLR